MGDECLHCHDPTIPRRSMKCQEVHPHGCPNQSLCAFLHDGEEWSVYMRPIVHPSYLATYLEGELAEAMSALEHAWAEIDRLRAALKDKNSPKSSNSQNSPKSPKACLLSELASEHEVPN